MFGWNPNQWLASNVSTETTIGAGIGAVAIGGIALLAAPVALPVVIGAACVIGAGAVASTLSATALTSGVVVGGVIAGAVVGHNAGSKENLKKAGDVIDRVNGVCTIAKNLNTKIPKPNSDPSNTTNTTIWKQIFADLFGKWRH